MPDDLAALRRRVVELQVQAVKRSLTQEEFSAAEEGIRRAAAALLHATFPAQSADEHYAGSTVCGPDGAFRANISLVTRLRTAIARAAPAAGPAPRSGRLAALRVQYEALEQTAAQAEDDAVRAEEQYAVLARLRAGRDAEEDALVRDMERRVAAAQERADAQQARLLALHARVQALSEFLAVDADTKAELAAVAPSCGFEERRAVLLAEMRAHEDAAAVYGETARRLEGCRDALDALLASELAGLRYGPALDQQRGLVAARVAQALGGPDPLASIRYEDLLADTRAGALDETAVPVEVLSRMTAEDRGPPRQAPAPRPAPAPESDAVLYAEGAAAREDGPRAARAPDDSARARSAPGTARPTHADALRARIQQKYGEACARLRRTPAPRAAADEVPGFLRGPATSPQRPRPPAHTPAAGGPRRAAPRAPASARPAGGPRALPAPEDRPAAPARTPPVRRAPPTPAAPAAPAAREAAAPARAPDAAAEARLADARRRALERQREYAERERRRQAGALSTRDSILRERDQRLEEFRRRRAQGSPSPVRVLTPSIRPRNRFDAAKEEARRPRPLEQAARADRRHDPADASSVYIDILDAIELDTLG